MRDFNDVSAQRVFRKQTDEGYLVVTANISGFQHNHPSGYFSLTYNLFATERAAKSGNSEASFSGGSSDEEIAKIAELRPFMSLHLSDADSGEPMHGKANAWWYFQTAFDLPGGWTIGKYDRVPEGKTESAEAYSRMCRALRVDESDFPGLLIGLRAKEIEGELAVANPNGEDEIAIDRHTRAMGMAFGEYVDNDCRPRWQAEAAAFRAFLDAEPELPTPHVNVETFSLTLEGSSGPLTITAKHDGQEWDDIGGHHVFKVTVKGTLKPKTFTSRFWASTHDYDRGHIDASEAAYGILRELVDIYWDEDGELLDMMKDQRDEQKRAASLRHYKRATTFAEAYVGTLEGNSDLIGR